MRKNMTTWVLLATILFGELHTLPMFSDDPLKLENWIWKAYKPMTQSWNMAYLEMQIKIPLYFFSFLLWKPTKVNKTTIRTFFYAGCLDVFLYLYNFKDPLFFGSFYVWMAAIWILVYYWSVLKEKVLKKRRKWNKTTFL